MKYAENLYPIGTIPKQLTAGAYMHGTLARNLDVYAKKIANDMHFLLIITGNDSVGNGKTTLATQVGSYLTWKINQIHGTNNTFDSSNIYFNAKKLAAQSLNKPPLTVHLLDEGDDLTTHGMKELAVRLKRYFRKCRQLNQIVILILPSFFELPKFYALARSHCLINVKFHGEFERGLFDFYGPSKKKLLYLKGKREWDYDCVKADFSGGFNGAYNFMTPDIATTLEEETKKYLKKKFEDTKDDQEEQVDQADAKRYTREILYKLNEAMPDISDRRWAEGFGVSARTISRWISEERVKNEKVENPETASAVHYSNITERREKLMGAAPEELDIIEQGLNDKE